MNMHATKLGIFITVISTIAFAVYVNPLSAQSTYILAGQYGCLVNKNFGGYEARLEGSARVGYHYMMYFDFTSKKSETINIHLVDGFGTKDAKTNWAQGLSSDVYSSLPGNISVNFVANSNSAYLVRNSLTSAGNTFVITYVVMPVNGGNTLLVSSGAGGNGDSTPFTGVCNKI